MTKIFLNAKKIAVIGNQGSGKTTLAMNLSDIIGINFVEIEYLASDFVLSEKIISGDNWIIDGDYGALKHADAILFLDFPVALCLQRGIKRWFKNFLGWNFLSLESYLKIPSRLALLSSWIMAVVRHPKNQRPKLMQTMSSRPKKKTITLKSPQEVDLFLEALKHNRQIAVSK